MYIRQEDPDALLIDRIRRDDQNAFAVLVRTHYARLFDLALSLTHVPAAAEDLVQDVFSNVWEGRQNWRPYPTARAYLFRAVRNRAYNYRRNARNRREADLSQAANAPGSAENPEDDLAFNELVADFQAALEEMPERRREVFRLSRLYGLTYEEIGAAMGISINTVRTQMTAALRHLRTRLAAHLHIFL